MTVRAKSEKTLKQNQLVTNELVNKGKSTNTISPFGTAYLFAAILFLSSFDHCTPGLCAEPPTSSADAPAVIDSVRFYPAKGHEQDVVGAVIMGSNISATAGFVPLGEIKSAPPSQKWTTLELDNRKPFRYLRYDAPSGSQCRIAELEFYAGKRPLKGPSFGSTTEHEAPGAWTRAFDGKTETEVNRTRADGQYIGIDTLDLATTKSPSMNPPTGDYQTSQKVTLASRTADATIIYTTDGSYPTAVPKNGSTYKEPIAVTKNTTIQAIAVARGEEPSPVSSSIYLIGTPVLSMNTLHVGNSLTNSTHNLHLYAKTLGYQNHYRAFLHGGATTKVLWEDATGPKSAEWEKDLQDFLEIDHFTLQPRDFNLDEEADNDMRFLDVVRQKWPALQPWLYAEWVEFERHRPTDLGKEKSPQMLAVWPAQSWEESMGAMLLYVEDLQNKIAELDKIKSDSDKSKPDSENRSSYKALKIIPSAIAMGWMHNMIENGKVPGMKPGSFHSSLFSDGVHPNAEGQYLVDLTWLCAFTGKPVNGAVPVDTKLSAEQAALMQKLAWDVVQNYPQAGLYKKGKKRVADPHLKSDKAQTGSTWKITCKTPDAWFRYTLDGSQPTHTHGYVYCGVLNAPEGTNLKVVAFKNGMADSNVVAQ